ncbi:MAG TPA: hypothetical protein VHV76_14555 [Mycobacteriales bacterium]|nr:hypothetical protein [Mycobacteriales bacterium]
MAVMGLDTSVIAPAIILLSRSWGLWRLLAWPAAIALPVFLVGHAALTIWMTLSMPMLPADLGFQVALITVSLIFWLPVLGRHRALSFAGRGIYLFLAMPTMDLAGVFVVLHGDSAGGLAMIVAMLPVGVTALLLTWQWMLEESAMADAADLRAVRFPPSAVGTRVSGKAVAAHGRTSNDRAAGGARAHH